LQTDYKVNVLFTALHSISPKADAKSLRQGCVWIGE